MKRTFAGKKQHVAQTALKPVCMIVAFIASLAVASMLAVAANAGGGIDCGSIDMDFLAAASSKECTSEDAGSNLWHGTAQTMVVKGDGFFLWVRRLKAGFNSYIQAEGATVFAKSFSQGVLKSVGAVTQHSGVSGYDVVLFSGRTNSGDFVDCFAFARYGGTVNARGGFSGPPGYAAAVFGAHCSAVADTISDDEIARVLGALRAQPD